MKAYVVGFGLSILLTVIPYFLVVNHMLPKVALVASISVAAILQLWIQLRFFLHLEWSAEGKSHIFAFVFTAVILLLLVFGSLWIMHDLNYFMMDPVMKEAGHAGH